MARIDGQSLGNGTAFSAVAPSQRPTCDAHQTKIFGSGIPTIMSPRARIPGRLTSKSLGQFPPAGLSVRPDPHCPAVWPVGHYRPVRCLSASTICRCITACRSDGRRAGLPRATLRGGFHGPLPGFYRFGGLVMTIASLRSSPKATTMREVLASNDVRTLIANQLGVDVKRVTNEAHFTDDLGADWLDRLELMIVIEDRFADVVITDEDVDQLEVVGDLIRHIEGVDNEGRGRSIVEAPLPVIHSHV